MIGYIPKVLNGTINEGKIEITNAEDNIYNVQINTKDLNKGYYTASIGEEFFMNWSEFEGITLFMKNMGEEELRLNINMQILDGTNFSISEKESIYINKNNRDYLSTIPSSYGLFPIDSKFEGRIYIPFNQLINNDLDIIPHLSEVTAFRVIIGAEENKFKSLQIGNFKLFNKESSINKAINSRVQIIGDKEVQIPIVGESIYFYRVENNDDAIFSLSKERKGSYITKEGKLSITEEALKENIDIIAESNGVKEAINVKFNESWTLSSNKIPRLLRENEVKELIKPNDNIFSSNGFFIVLRIILSSTSFLILILYLKWEKTKSFKAKL